MSESPSCASSSQFLQAIWCCSATSSDVEAVDFDSTEHLPLRRNVARSPPGGEVNLGDIFEKTLGFEPRTQWCVDMVAGSERPHIQDQKIVPLFLLALASLSADLAAARLCVQRACLSGFISSPGLLLHAVAHCIILLVIHQACSSSFFRLIDYLQSSPA